MSSPSPTSPTLPLTVEGDEAVLRELAEDIAKDPELAALFVGEVRTLPADEEYGNDLLAQFLLDAASNATGDMAAAAAIVAVIRLQAWAAEHGNLRWWGAADDASDDAEDRQASLLKPREDDKGPSEPTT